MEDLAGDELSPLLLGRVECGLHAKSQDYSGNENDREFASTTVQQLHSAMLSPEPVCLVEHGHAVDGARLGACIGRASEKGGVRGWVGIARGFIGRVDEAYSTRFFRPKDGTVSGISLSKSG